RAAAARRSRSGQTTWQVMVGSMRIMPSSRSFSSMASTPEVAGETERCDDSKLVVAISARALFDLNESHDLFESEGLEAYRDYQMSRENELLAPGIAFPLVQKLLKLNEPPPAEPRVEVILLSRNSSDTGLRIFNSI